MAIKRLNLCGQVVHNLGTDIISGKIKPGEGIPHEEILLESFGVSRTVIREAIRSLAAKGLLESKPKRGTIVRPQEQWNYLDPEVLSWSIQSDKTGEFLVHLTRLRKGMEPSAAYYAALNATDEEVQQIAEAAETMEKATDDLDMYLEADIRFHSVILRAAHNPLLGPMINVISSALKFSLEITNRKVSQNRKSVPFHKAIADAISERDADKAQAAMMDHFSDVDSRLNAQ